MRGVRKRRNKIKNKKDAKHRPLKKTGEAVKLRADDWMQEI